MILRVVAHGPFVLEICNHDQCEIKCHDLIRPRHSGLTIGAPPKFFLLRNNVERSLCSCVYFALGIIVSM